MKLNLGPLSGLPFTASQGLPEGFARDVALSILYLLQLDRNPVTLCGTLHTVFSASAQHSKEVSNQCLLPLATKINILTSVSLPQNTELLAEAFTNYHANYCDWEIKYFEATLAFAQFDFVRCTELCSTALKDEPRDAFSARLMFISSFHCGLSCKLAESLMEAIPKLAPDFAAKAYYLGLLGFAMHEASLGTPSQALSLALEGIELVKAQNECAYLGEKWIHPFAVHTVCHVLGSDPSEGLRYIEEVIPPSLWEGSSFFANHLYYHIITMMMDSNKMLEASDMYSTKLWPLVSEEDLYTVSDASSIICRFKLADILEQNDSRPQQLMHKWLQSVNSFPSMNNIPFFVMNFAVADSLFGDKETNKASSLTVAKCDEPFRSVFESVLARDKDQLEATKPFWSSIGGSRGQVDILQKFWVWLVGLNAPYEAAAELRRASVQTPKIVYYERRARQYESTLSVQ